MNSKTMYLQHQVPSMKYSKIDSQFTKYYYILKNIFSFNLGIMVIQYYIIHGYMLI